MSENESLIQLRVDEDLKKQFFQLAQRNGESPSNYLRGYMRRAVEKDTGRVEDIAHELVQLREILRESLSYIQRSALTSSDERNWQIYKETFLPEYLYELIGDTLHDSGLHGQQYSKQLKDSVQQDWFIDTSKARVPLKSYLRRDFMDQVRRELAYAEPSKLDDERSSPAGD